MEDMSLCESMNMSMTMQMTFHNNDFKLYFDSWNVDNDFRYVITIAALFLAAIGLELVHFLAKLTAVYLKKVPKSDYITILLNLGNLCLFFLWVTLSYLLMLAIMTYSIGVFWAITTGLTCGHILFRIIKSASPIANESLYEELLVKNPCIKN
ncbi:unnamed protein product [Blepharisma stoltei]|uniref:Copper transport protein n=1 Tax=Blepharisma stoltei TaxID=1481888 RepID=A0AAU9IVY5_9CILI|nr:unnamed protein product [Blepharisma stoltei]